MKKYQTLYTWVLNAIESELDWDTIIRVYVYTGDDELITKGTINDLFKECRIDDNLADAIIHDWYAWAKDDVVINLNEDPYEDRDFAED